jgi:hypothetical protein
VKLRIGSKAGKSIRESTLLLRTIGYLPANLVSSDFRPSIHDGYLGCNPACSM